MTRRRLYKNVLDWDGLKARIVRVNSHDNMVVMLEGPKKDVERKFAKKDCLRITDVIAVQPDMPDLTTTPPRRKMHKGPATETDATTSMSVEADKLFAASSGQDL